MSENIATTSSENTTSLKYEKTQNRDIVNTIERINRSQVFKPVAEEIVSKFNKVVHESAIKIFKEEWRNNHESHENPKNLTVEVSIGSPLYKKRDEGIFYSIGMSTTFYVDETLQENETQSEAESRVAMWFSEKISGKLNKKIVEQLSVITSNDERFSKKFWYPLLDTTESDTGKIGKTPKFNMINVSYMTSLRLRKNDSSNADIVPFDDSEAVHDGLVSNMAMAFERISTADATESENN